MIQSAELGAQIAAVAGLDARRDRGPGGAHHVLRELGIADPPVAVDDRLAVGEPLRAGQGESGNAHVLLVEAHANQATFRA